MSTRRPVDGLLPLLAAGARTYLDEAAVCELRRQVSPGIDWTSLVRDARLHGVVPLVARNLSTHAADLVPPPELERLRNQYRAQAARNTLMFGRFLDVSERLRDAGVPAIAIKGPALACRAYGDLSLRQFSDLDFLIRERDLDAIVDTMGEAGYRHLRTGRNWQYVKFQSPEGFNLDLQWGLGPAWFRFPLDFETSWDRAVLRDRHGSAVLELSDHDTVLLLCGHATKHCWSKLGWVADLNEYLQSHGHRVDWEELIREATRLGGLRSLFLGLALVSEVLGSDIPAEATYMIGRERQLRDLTRVVRRKLGASGEALAPGEGAFSPRESRQFHFAVRERLRDRAPHARFLLKRWLDWRPLARRAMRSGRRLRPSTRP